MKKVFALLIVLFIALALISAWILFGSATSFSESNKYLLVYSGKANKEAVMQSIYEDDLLKYPRIFSIVASELDVWEKLNPGRFEIRKGDNMINIVRMLRNNRQAPVNLVINKLRTQEDLAKILGRNFEADSTEVMQFINNSDSLSALGVDENTLMTLVIPNTYSLFWTTPVNKIFKRLKSEQEQWWEKNNRLKKAADLQLTPQQVYIIASIVEEETNKNDEKGKVASVYINRLRNGMPLGADPTIKFALKDFSLKRIYHKHLQVKSPYNTYLNAGLPPGPISTPSTKTLDAVLNAPQTNYLYFVARKDFSGYHTFSTTYTQHLQNAREYQKALDELILRKKNAN